MKVELTPEQREKRVKTNKKIMKFGCLPIVILFVVVFIISLFMPKDEKVAQNLDLVNGKNQNIAKPISESQKKEKAIIDIVNGFKEGDGNSYAYDSIKSPNTAGMFLFFESIWNEKRLLAKHWKNSIEFAQKAFEIKGVDTVIFSTQVKLTDALGNTNKSTVLRIGYLRSKFMQVKWENIKNMPLLNTLSVISEESLAYMHGSIQSKLTLSDYKEIYY